MNLFSDRALNQLFNASNGQKKVYNKEYDKLRKELKNYKQANGYVKGTRLTDYDFVDKFYNCTDFLTGGMSFHKIKSGEYSGKYLVRMSVLPKGNVKRTYYTFIVDYDDRMIDKKLFE